MKLLGTSKLSSRKSITLIEPVTAALNMTEGNHIAFIQSDDGRIYIKNLADINIGAEHP